MVANYARKYENFFQSASSLAAPAKSNGSETSRNTECESDLGEHNNRASRGNRARPAEVVLSYAR